MLKGHVFSKQLFGNPIFALFINTFLNGKDGISNNYKNGMNVTYSGSTVTVDSGAVCIQGRFLEEDTSTPITAGTDSAYCKLVIEIDLDKQNTESEFVQGAYKIIKSTSGYPNLTQTNIVKNNAGIYQYELARFRTTTNGIIEFQDQRTFLDFNSIYNAIQTEYREVLEQLETELANVEDGSAYLLKNETNVEKITKILKDENVTINMTLRKQLNIVYINLDFEIPYNITKIIAIPSVIPSEYLPNEDMEITVMDSNSETKYLKLYIKTNGGITGLINNGNNSNKLIAQATYIID